MKKNSKERLFEVMSRLDKTFKPKLNEEIGDMDDNGMPDTGQAPDFQNMSEPTEMPDEEGVEVKSAEDKIIELTAKVDELYAMLHGESEEEESEPEDVEVVDAENLQEWNFDKKKGEKEDEKDEEGKEHEKKESPEFEKGEEEGEEEGKKEEKKELDEAKPKIPIVPIAKVGK